MKKRTSMNIFLALLGVLFIGLKLTHQIDWSWWYVTLPIWGGAAFGLALLILTVLGAFAVALIKK